MSDVLRFTPSDAEANVEKSEKSALETWVSCSALSVARQTFLRGLRYTCDVYRQTIMHNFLNEYIQPSEDRILQCPRVVSSRSESHRSVQSRQILLDGGTNVWRKLRQYLQRFLLNDHISHRQEATIP